MKRISTPESKPWNTLKWLAIITLLSAFSQVTLGGYVRSSESGLGCPDWPLCHGQLIPPFEFHTLVEYSHRLNASLLMVFVGTLSLLCWFRFREEKIVIRLAGAALGLVLCVAVLGGITVLTELVWWIRLIHLSLAELLIGSVTAIVGLTFYTNKSSSLDTKGIATPNWRKKLWVISVGLFLLIISGSYMVGAGAGSACSTWPLCRGDLFPGGAIYAIHMGHRYIAGLMVLIAAFIVWSFIKNDGHIPAVKRVSMTLIHSLLLQIVLGAILVWGGFNPALKTIHLALATLVWIATIYMVSCITQYKPAYSKDK
ncbi:MAG: cytochrome c oxidase assembly protein subunit 15/protoheme IX farnesyltransferase [Chloroflexi bacterium]|nr:MAG: cytochrome c oxidase assembly protein subunit 15/protoheme IX farnesyltransferase [Chloroflexota bacterium]